MAFGSRVDKTAKETSDLDLVVIGDEPLDFLTPGTLRDAFSASDLPCKVDVLDRTRVSQTFRDIIRRGRIVICEGQKRAPSGGDGSALENLQSLHRTRPVFILTTPPIRARPIPQTSAPEFRRRSEIFEFSKKETGRTESSRSIREPIP